MPTNQLLTTHRGAALSLEPWLDGVRDAYVHLDFEATDVGVFRGALAVFELGEMALDDLAHDPLRVSRTEQSIKQDQVQFYKVALQLEGYSIVEQDGRESAVAPGDLVVYDTSRPFVITTNEVSRSLIMSCPHGRLGIANDLMRGLMAVRMSGRNGLGSVTSTYLAQLELGLADGSVKASRQLEESALSLLRTLFNDQLEKSFADHPDDMLLMHQVLASIEERLGDPELSVASIAAEHFMTVRHLQRLFQQRGLTFTRWVRERRLNRCREELLASGGSAKNVRDVAIQWGIHDAAHFSRIFRELFGRTPSEYRIEHRGQ